MDSFIAIREKARSLRSEIEADSEQLTGPQVVAKLLQREGYELLKLQADDALLHQAEAVLDREMAAVYLKEGASLEAETALIAHELGHLYLHEGPRCCAPEEVDVSSAVEGGASSTMEGYGARERRELQANVFGRELLLPGSLARDLFLKENWRASTIADKLILPPDIVFQQLCDALLVPLTPEPSKPEKSEKPGLNQLQKEAAEHWGSPLLLEAGPGTGKTRTLVARIEPC